MSSTVPDDAKTWVSPSEYSRFIGQIELLSIWLASAEIDNSAGFEPPARGKFSIEDEATWAPQAGIGFVVKNRYTVELRDETVLAMRLQVEYAVLYRSTAPITAELFEVFKHVNLPLNVWPYLREYLANTLGRFGWPPFTLPAFKVNTPPHADAQGDTLEPTSRKRRGAGKTHQASKPAGNG